MAVSRSLIQVVSTSFKTNFVTLTNDVTLPPNVGGRYLRYGQTSLLL